MIQPEQEPVAWRWLYNGKPDSDKCFDGKGPDADVIFRVANAQFPRTVQYFYTAPPKREWEWLTMPEMVKALEEANLPSSFSYRMAGLAVELAAKEKNFDPR